jgi:pimeloyl-ACP methyl ester carboxylesterase
MGIYRSAAGKAAVLSAYRDMLKQWPVPAEQMSVPTRHGDTFVLAAGPVDAPALVLLHGSAANSASWVGDMPVWARDFRVYALDVIGEPGLSAPSRPPLKSDAYAEWPDDVLERLGLGSADFVGLSLGGWVALDYAVRRPQRVSRLVLISPGGVGRNRNILIWALPLLLLGRWGRSKMMERIGGPVMSDPAFQQSPIGRLSALIFQHFNPRTESLPVHSEAQLQALPMPVMAVLGGKDVFIDAPLARDRLQANVRRLTIRYLPEGLHFLPGQAEAVAGFLKG